MDKDLGRVASPNRLSQQAVEPVSRLNPTGFDPARIAALRGLAEAFDMHPCYSRVDGPKELLSYLNVMAGLSAERVDRVVNAMLTYRVSDRRVETTEIGSIEDESAGPKDDAHNQEG